jgi:hypothetical protein
MPFARLLLACHVAVNSFLQCLKYVSLALLQEKLFPIDMIFPEWCNIPYVFIKGE